MVTRDQVHQLVEVLPEHDLELAQRYLEALARGEVYDLEAWIDDAPLTDDEREAVEEGWQDIEAGRVMSHDEARRRLLGDA